MGIWWHNRSTQLKQMPYRLNPFTNNFDETGGAGSVGPQGPAGPTGATGPAGPAGANGANGQGVPVGGTTGQVLSKASNTNYDTAWTTVATGTDINGQTQVESALNDELIIYDTSASANRKALVRDIGCQGVGGWGFANKIHTNYLTGSSPTGSAFTVDRIYYIPILFPQSRTFNTVGTRLSSTTGSASNVARFGLYHMNNGFPGNRAADFGTFNLGGTVNSERQISINYTVEAGFYYTAFVTNDSAALFNRQQSYIIQELYLLTGMDNAGDSGFTHLYQQLAGSASGGLPATASSIVKGSGNHPVVLFQNV